MEREFKEVLREKDKLLEENLNLNEKVRNLKAEFENLLEKVKENMKNEEVFEENKIKGNIWINKWILYFN